MARLNVAIMGHPARSRAATLLANALHEFDPVIVWDPAPDQEPSALRTAAAAWAAVGSAEYHLVVQDDVALCHDFASLLDKCVQCMPTPMTALFADWASANGQSVRLAALRGDSYAPVIQRSVPPQAIVARRDEALGLARACAQAVAAGRSRDSQVVWEFSVERGCGARIAVPNLVQHDVHATASLWPLKIRRGPIRAACFADHVPGPIEFQIVESERILQTPYVNWEQQALIASPAPQFGQLPALDWLVSQGSDAAGLVAEFREGLRPHRAGLSPLSTPLLFELYLACAATARLGHALDAIRSPVAAAALETMLPGAARNTVDLSSCPGLCQAARDYLLDIMDSLK